ncbi:MAG: protein kinase [Anaerolineae bacterium]
MSEDRIIANRFKIEAMLGQGGMGTVYRGTDTQTGQTVAIKSLKAEIIAEDPSILQRFEREGEALRMLNHPNIVKMLAAVEENGQHYLVMEYVGGGSLLDLLRQNEQLPVQRVLEIALDLADALTRAHRLKIIHRDIKPANVMLTDDGTPKLTDFGVAQMGNFTRMTQTGAFVGTYAYLSPEVLTGEQLDARTDIWAFGVMLYEMLAGQRPFEAEQTAAMLAAILNKPAPPLSQFRSDIPLEVENLIMRMLEKDRDARVNSVRLVGAQIEAILSGDTSQVNELQKSSSSPLPASFESERFGTPTPTASMGIGGGAMGTPTPGTSMFGARIPDGTIAPTSKPTRKVNPLLIGVGIVLLLVLVIGAGLLLKGGGTQTIASVATVQPVTSSEYMVLVAQFEALSGEARDVQRFIAENLRQTLEVNVAFSNLRVREYPGVVRSYEEALAAAEANGASVVVWGNYDSSSVTVQVQIGTTVGFSHITFERTLLDRMGSVQVQLTNERQESIAPLVVGEMVVLNNADGNGYEVVRQLALLGALELPPIALEGNSVATRAFRVMQTYNLDREQALEEVSAALEQDTSNPLLYSLRCLLYFSQGPDYFDDTQRDIVTMKRLASDSWMIPQYMEASIADASGDLQGALAAYSEIVDQRPEEWFPLNYRAAMRYLLGDYDGAREDYARVLTMNPDANFPYIASTVLAMRDGRISDARSYINIIVTRFPDPSFANRIVATYYGENTNIFAPLFSAFGNIVLGQYDAAIQYAQEAEQVMPTLADSYVLEGLAQCSLQNYAEAETAYTRALEIDNSFTLIYGLRAQVRQNLGDVLGALSDFSVVNEADLGPEFEQLAAQAVAGQIDCTNFFDS